LGHREAGYAQAIVITDLDPKQTFAITRDRFTATRDTACHSYLLNMTGSFASLSNAYVAVPTTTS
jgi:hypothetical protein